MFKDGARFKQHKEKHKTDTAAILKCIFNCCQETLSVPKDLMTHTKQLKIHKCDVPGCLFTSKLISNMQVHRRIVHSIFLHTCQLCGKGFDWTSNLKQHRQSHETGEPGVIKCAKNRCKQKFNYVSDLKKHLNNHKSLFLQQIKSKLNAKEYVCQLCGKIIKNNRSKFQAHVVKHETESPGVP
jgi:KRAB domain-containing zinc finger protein